MGWTYMNAHGEKNKKALMTRELERYGTVKVLKCAMVNGVYYAAYSPTKDPSRVIGIVCLTRLSDGEFGYKDMEESMGPFESKCPMSIIEMLTPTDSKYANEWRERCRAYAASHSNSVIKALNALPIGTLIAVEGKIYKKWPASHQFKTPYFADKFDCFYIPKTRIKSFTVIAQ